MKMPFLYITVLLIVFEEIRCDDTFLGGVEDVNRTCNSTQDCSRRFGGSARVCVGGVCVCKNDYYESGGSCLQCSAFHESCEVSKCCVFSKLVSCDDNICKCRSDHDLTEFSACWRRSQGKQNILSFAKLLLGAILALSLAALFGILRQLCHRPEVMESSSGFQRSFPYESFNSIQRYVMQKLKDRPPRYEDIQKECGGNPSPSSSHDVWRSGNRARGTLPPSYQAFSTPSSSAMDLSIPPPPYTSAPYEPSDLFIPPEAYTRSVESTPLVFQISSRNGSNMGLGQHNPVYQSTAADPCTSISQNGSLTSISEVSSSLLPSSSTSLQTSTLSSVTTQSNNTSTEKSKLPSYSQLEIVLSPKTMNDCYLSQETQQRSQIAEQPLYRSGIEYQTGDDMVEFRVIDSEKLLNVVHDNLIFDTPIQESISNISSDTSEACVSNLRSVQHIEHELADDTYARNIGKIINNESVNVTISGIQTEIESSNTNDASKKDNSNIFLDIENVSKDSANTHCDAVDTNKNTWGSNVEFVGSIVENLGKTIKETDTNLVIENCGAQVVDLDSSISKAFKGNRNPMNGKITLDENEEVGARLERVNINDCINETVVTLKPRDTTEDQVVLEIKPHQLSTEDHLPSVSNMCDSNSVEGHSERCVTKIAASLLDDKTSLVYVDGDHTRGGAENSDNDKVDKGDKFVTTTELPQDNSTFKQSHSGVTVDNEPNSVVVTAAVNKTDSSSIHNTDSKETS